jgi:hypothetical protein
MLTTKVFIVNTTKRIYLPDLMTMKMNRTGRRRRILVNVRRNNTMRSFFIDWTLSMLSPQVRHNGGVDALFGVRLKNISVEHHLFSGM